MIFEKFKNANFFKNFSNKCKSFMKIIDLKMDILYKKIKKLYIRIKRSKYWYNFNFR